MKKVKSSILSGKSLFAFDLGNGYCKVKSVETAAEYPSIYGVLSRRNTLVNLNDYLIIEFNDTRYVFGDDVRLLCDTEPTALTSRIRYTSDRYRLLFASALMKTFGHQVGQEIIYPRGVISIPVGEFNIQKDKEVRELLQGEYAIHNLSGGTLYVHLNPQDLIIIPEGLGTFWLEAFAPDGSMYERYAQGGAAVVDIGYYTTDVVLMQNGIYVVGGAQSADIGMGNVAEAVLEELRRQGAYGLDVWEVDKHLHEERIEINGRDYPLTPIVEKELMTLTERVQNFVKTTLRGKNVRTVILGGGGGSLVEPYLKDEWLLSVSPRRGNVEGAFEFLLRREQGQ